jgi:alpha-beta hydrolase superfamily lysophospholipase
VHLLANCWGARPALAHAALSPHGLASLILMAPALLTRADFGPTDKLRIAQDALLNPQQKHRHPITDGRLFTRDTRWVKMIETDTLALHACTARFYWQTLRLTKRLPGLLPRVCVPTLALFGGSDQVLDLPRTHELIRRIPADLLTVKTYPGQWHMLEFEPDSARVIDDLLAWIEKR